MPLMTTEELVGLGTLAGAAFAVTLLFLSFFVVLYRALRRKPAPTPTRLQGSEAMVVLAVPNDGVGTISCNAAGKRVVMPARSYEGTALEAGRSVVIVEVEGRVALVAAC